MLLELLYTFVLSSNTIKFGAQGEVLPNTPPNRRCACQQSLIFGSKFGERILHIFLIFPAQVWPLKICFLDKEIKALFSINSQNELSVKLFLGEPLSFLGLI